MKYGLTEDQYQYILQTVVIPMDRAGAEVWCFGSRARGDHQSHSDLDLMVEADQDLAHLIGEIRETLTQGHFPYKVDLVHSKDFAESYRSNYLKERVRLLPSD